MGGASALWRRNAAARDDSAARGARRGAGGARGARRGGSRLHKKKPPERARARTFKAALLNSATVLAAAWRAAQRARIRLSARGGGMIAEQRLEKVHGSRRTHGRPSEATRRAERVMAIVQQRKAVAVR